MNILCDILVNRTEVVTKPTSSGFYISLTDTTTIPIGSSVYCTESKQRATISSITSTGLINTIPEMNTFIPFSFRNGRKIEVVISSIFRYCNQGTTELTTVDGESVLYKSGLSIPNIAEGFNGGGDKKQKLANANIVINNTNHELTNIFHSYDFFSGEIIISYITDTNTLADASVFFSGVMNDKSNFKYNESVFSFSAKDSRTLTLNSKLHTEFYTKEQFSKYEIIKNPMSILELQVTGLPADWAIGYPVKTLTGSAVIARIDAGTTATIALHSYNGVISIGQDIISDLSSNPISPATVPVVGIVPLPSNIDYKGGGNGRFIGLADNKTPSVANIPGAQLLTTKTVVKTKELLGVAYSVKITKTPIHHSHSFNVTYAVGLGFVDDIKVKLSAGPAITILPISVTMSLKIGNIIRSVKIPKQTLGVISLIGLFGKEDITIDENQEVTIWFNYETTSHKGITPLLYDLHLDSIEITTTPRISLGSSYSITTPINIASSSITTDSGKLFFNRSKSFDINGNNLCSISVTIKTPSGAFRNYDNIVRPGISIDTQIGGVDITEIVYNIGLKAPTNLIDPVDITSVFVAFETTKVIGASVDSKLIDTPVPILLGDFSTTTVPCTRIKTVKDIATLTATYTFSAVGTASNALTYTLISGQDSLRVGDTVVYTELGGSETIYAKITQKIVGTKTIYFQDYSIVPDPTTVVIERHTNTYKICSNSVQSIDSVVVSNSNSNINQSLPSYVTKEDDLANGEFTLYGNNAEDIILASVVGISATGYAYSTFEQLLLELLPNFAFNFESLDPKLLNSIKVRAYESKDITISDLITNISTSFGIYASLGTNNTISFISQNLTKLPKYYYYDGSILDSNRGEEYDPYNEFGETLALKYSFTPSDNTRGLEEIVGIYSTGNNIVDVTNDYIYEKIDAEYLVDSLYSTRFKRPELAILTIGSHNVMDIKIGDIIQTNYKGTEHVLFVFDFVKKPNSTSIDISAYIMNNSYKTIIPSNIYTFPDVIMPAESLVTKPWLLSARNLVNDIDSTIPDLSKLGNIVNTVGSKSYTAIVPVNGVVDNQVVFTNGQSAITYAVDILYTDILIEFTEYVLFGGGYAKVVVFQEGAIITGDELLDISANPGSISHYLSTSTANPAVSIAITNSVTTNSLVVCYFKNMWINNLEVSVDSPTQVFNSTNVWNPNWSDKQKVYFLKNKQITNAPINGVIESKDGSTIDYTNDFIRKIS